MNFENKQIKVKDILEVTKGKLVIGNPEEICKKFCFDTRILEKDDVYVGLKGEKIDGSTLWEEAFTNNAKIVIVQNIKFEEAELKQYIQSGKTIIEVEDTLKAISQIAAYKRSLYNIPVVGVTGSVGKTSTKDIIASVVSQKYNTLKTEGNNNNHIGVPKTILRLQNEEAAVIEMGMNHFGEISKLTQIARPTLSVITNIGTSHIGNLGSRENILKAKLEILEGMKEKKIVINNDNDLLHAWYEQNKNKCDIVTYGINNTSDFMAEQITLNENSSEFICQVEGNKIVVKVPVGGEHFIYNALCAIAVGKSLNINNDAIIKGIANFELTKKRMEIIHLKDNITLINDAYNASYESIKESLKYINNLSSGRKIAVLGDVLELGEFAEELHKKIGTEVAKQNVDLLICCGKNAKYICEKALQNGMAADKVFYEKDIEDVTRRIEQNMMENDIILIKASNAMRFSNIAVKLTAEFSN